MAITLGTPTNSGNQATTTSFSFAHTTATNTKCLVVVITGYDSSATDSAVSSVVWDSAGVNESLTQIAGGRYRVGSDFQDIWYKVNPTIQGPKNITVTMGGSCTDVQATAIGLIDANAKSIEYDSFDTGTGTGSASAIISPAKQGSYAVGGGVAVGGTPASLSVTAGAEISGSEVDMGSQTASCATAATSGTTATMTWTYSAVVCTALGATFYSKDLFADNSAKAYIFGPFTRNNSARAWIHKAPNGFYGAKDVEAFTSQIMSASTNWVGLRFQPWSNLTVTSISLYFTASTSPPDYLVSIVNDNGGQPGTTEYTSGTITSPAVGWSTASVTSYELTQGTTYWIQIHYTGSKTIGGSNYATVAGGTSGATEYNYPYNREYGNFYLSTSSNSGGSWTGQDVGSIFFLNETVGYGTTAMASFIMYAGNYKGEKFTFGSDVTISNLKFLAKDIGTPPGDLLYEIRDSGNNTLRSGTIATAAQTTTAFQQFTATLSSPITFTAGESYSVIGYLSGGGGTTSNAYYFYASQISPTGATTPMNNATYGALSCYPIASTDSGSSWTGSSSYPAYDLGIDAVYFYSKNNSAKACIVSVRQETNHTGSGSAYSLYGSTGTNEAWGSYFKARRAWLLYLKLYFASTYGTVTDNVIFTLRDSPGGTVLATHTIAATSIIYGLNTFVFPTRIQLTPGQSYFVQIDRSGTRSESNFTTPCGNAQYDFITGLYSRDNGVWSVYSANYDLEREEYYTDEPNANTAYAHSVKASIQKNPAYENQGSGVYSNNAGSVGGTAFTDAQYADVLVDDTSYVTAVGGYSNGPVQGYKKGFATNTSMTFYWKGKNSGAADTFNFYFYDWIAKDWDLIQTISTSSSDTEAYIDVPNSSEHRLYFGGMYWVSVAIKSTSSWSAKIDTNLAIYYENGTIEPNWVKADIGEPVSGSTKKENSTLANIKRTLTNDVSAKASIVITTTSVMSVKTNVKTTSTNDNSSKASLVVLTTKGQSTVANIKVTNSKDISVKASISVTSTYGISAKANVVVANVKEESSKADIKVTSTKDQSVKADIYVQDGPYYVGNMVIDPSMENGTPDWTNVYQSGSGAGSHVNYWASEGSWQWIIQGSWLSGWEYILRADGLILKAGHTYQVTATMMSDWPGLFYRIFRFEKIGGGGAFDSVNYTFTNSYTYYRVTTSYSTGAYDCYFYLNALPNTTGLQALWYDAFQIEDVTTGTVYWDGDYSGARWIGSQDHSQSVKGGQRQWSLASITVSNSNNQSAKASVVVTTTASQSAKADIKTTAAVTKDTSSKANISVTNSYGQSARAYIFLQNLTAGQSTLANILRRNIASDQSTKANVVANIVVGQSVKASIVSTTTKGISVLANIKRTTTSDISAKASISVATSSPQSAKADIYVTGNTKDNSAKASVVVTNRKDVSSLADIKATTSVGQSAKADIIATVTSNASVKANIKRTFSVDQFALANIILRNNAYGQSARASIVVSTVNGQSALANVITSNTKDTSVKANILSRNNTMDVSARASIVWANAKNVFALANIFVNNNTVNNSAKASVMVASSFAVSVKADIKRTFTVDQSSLANITTGNTFGQSVKANIFAGNSVGQSVKANIVKTTYQPPPQDWYNASWPYRVKVTVLASKVDADLTDYPVYVDLSLLPAGFHTYVNQTDARDIRVTTSNGLTEIPREVVHYDATTDTGELHFKADVDGDTDTDFYIYYGNSSASDYSDTDTYGTHNVWNTHYKAVFHEQGAGSDSSSVGNDLTDSGSVTYNASYGKLGGKGASFNGSSLQARASSIGLPAGSAQVSFGGWFKTSVDGSFYVTGYGTNSNGMRNGLLQYKPNGVFYADLVNYNRNFVWTYTTEWQHIYFVFPDGQTDCALTRLYLNGSEVTYNGSLSGTKNIYNGSLTIGAMPALGFYPLTGYIDEIRYQDIEITPQWISTEYNNQSSASTFFTIGTQEVYGGGAYWAKANIQVSSAFENSVRAQIISVVTKNNSAKAHIYLIQTKDQSVKADIFVRNTTYGNSAKALIATAGQYPNSVKADIFVANATYDNSARASLYYKDVAKDVSAKANIVGISPQWAKANVVVSILNVQSVRANIKRTTTVDISIKANIFVSGSTNNNSARANIKTVNSKDSNAKANIVVGNTNNQSVKADIRVNNNTVNQSARASLYYIQTKNNSAKARVIPWWLATSLTINAGAIVSGDLDSTYYDDGTKLTLSEVNAAPGFDYEFHFYTVTQTSLQLNLLGNYTGNLGHIVKVKIYNYNTTLWENVIPGGTDIPYSATEDHYNFTLPLLTSDYLQNGIVRIKFYHQTVGDTGHQFIIDTLSLESLTSFSQSVRADILRRNLTSDISALGNVLVRNTTKDVSAKASVVTYNSRNQSVLANIRSTNTVQTSSKANISVSNANNNSVKANISVRNTRDISSVANILVRNNTKDNSVRAYLFLIQTKDVSAKANILVRNTTKDTSARAFLMVSGAYLFYAKANISVAGNTVNQSAKASISVRNSINQSVKANVFVVGICGQSVKANVRITLSNTISVKASIVVTSQYGQSVIANLFRANVTADNSVKAHILVSGTKTYDNFVRAMIAYGFMLVSPPNDSTVTHTNVEFRWKVPYRPDGKPCYFVLEVSRDSGFTDLEKKLWSTHQTGFEYYDGAAWQPMPKVGVSMIYAGNEARITTYVPVSTRYWRVRGGAM